MILDIFYIYIRVPSSRPEMASNWGEQFAPGSHAARLGIASSSDYDQVRAGLSHLGGSFQGGARAMAAASFMSVNETFFYATVVPMVMADEVRS